MNRHLIPAYWPLRIGLGLGAFLAGLDKFFGLLANWENAFKKKIGGSEDAFIAELRGSNGSCLYRWDVSGTILRAKMIRPAAVQ